MAGKPDLSTVYSIVGKESGSALATLLTVANSRHGPGAHARPSRQTNALRHDHLRTPEEAIAFLAENDIAVPHQSLGPDDLAALRGLRQAVWALASRQNAPPAAGPLRLFSTMTYRLSATGRLEPTEGGWRGFIAALLPGLVEAQARRDQVKACRNPTCGWLFLDSTKNRSRVWCDMSVCGNRAKVGRYAQRRPKAQHPEGAG